MKFIAVFFALLSVISLAVIKIGVVLPMTGGLLDAGEAAWNSLNLAYEEKHDVLGKEIQLILVDNKSEKSKSAEAFRKLIYEKGVVAIIGAMSSGNTLAGAPIAEEKHIPVISPSSTNPLVTQSWKYINRVCFTDSFQGAAAARFAYEEMGSRRIVVFANVDQDYSVGLANFFSRKFQKLGGKGVKILRVFYRSVDKDFSTQIAAAMQFDADTIYISGYCKEAALIVRQAREMGFNGKFLAGDGVECPDLIKIGGKAAEGMYFTTHYHPSVATNEISRRFTTEYEKKYKETPSAIAALTYDAYMVLLKAMEMARSSNPEEIAKNIRKIRNFQGVTGRITIDENGNVVKPVVVDIVRNGRFEFVETIYPKSTR